MPAPIFVDTNVPIYAAGRAHPLKAPCAAALRLISEHPRRFITSAEVLQELLHRYLALRAWPQGQVVLKSFADLMEDRITSVRRADVLRAAELANPQIPGTSARDLLHLAVMERVGTDLVVSADRGFDAIPQVRRLDPADVSTWHTEVLP